ncbi:response regulator [uncultured Methylobacterium sp.]|uniref:response regulator n=1 Tax=uncultured Methylobacterium sp. TaxID=157278 RepID=UPI0035CA590F
MKTCLVVDDSAVIRKVARRIIETLGFAVVEAEDGSDALLRCAEAMPDMILLDWNMPNMDGYSFLQALRQRPEGAGPKILFCTTENDVGAIARALRAGADEYIMKPFDRDILRAKLEQVGIVQADAA